MTTPFLNLRSQPESNLPSISDCEKFPWILNPVLDLLFCCGGLVWILLLFQDCILSNLNSRWSQIAATITLSSAHLFAEAHVSATFFKIYQSKESRQQFRLCSFWQTILTLCVCLAGLFFPPVTAALLKLYLLWVYQHFTGQAYGLILIYCMKAKFTLSAFERAILSLLLNCTAIEAITRQLLPSTESPQYFLGIDLPVWNFIPTQIHSTVYYLLLATIFVFAYIIIMRALKQQNLFPIPALLLLVTIVTAISTQLADRLWIYLPAFFHATQYLAITASQYIKQQDGQSTPSNEVWRKVVSLQGLNYYSNLLVLSVLLYVLVPAFLQLLGFPQALSFATIFVVLNLHHFASDAIIWKMRDPKTRSQLI